MFGKVFASLWEGSMVGDADAQLVFVFMLANCDPDGVLDKTQEVISALTGIPLQRVHEAVLRLESPDPRSRTPDQEGRRLTRLDDHRDWGWLIVNREKYRQLCNQESRREQNRDHRRQQRSAAVSARQQLSALSAQEETELEKEKSSNTCPAKPDMDWMGFFEDHVWPKRPRKGAPGAAAAESHKAAAARWARIKPQTQQNADRIADALEADVAEMRRAGREGEKCPHLSTWLSQERWEAVTP